MPNRADKDEFLRPIAAESPQALQSSAVDLQRKAGLRLKREQMPAFKKMIIFNKFFIK